jgi:hypothetical protein
MDAFCSRRWSIEPAARCERRAGGSTCECPILARSVSRTGTYSPDAGVLAPCFTNKSSRLGAESPGSIACGDATGALGDDGYHCYRLTSQFGSALLFNRSEQGIEVDVDNTQRHSFGGARQARARERAYFVPVLCGVSRRVPNNRRFFRIKPQNKGLSARISPELNREKSPNLLDLGGIFVTLCTPRFWGNESGLAGPFFVCGTDY